MGRSHRFLAIVLLVMQIVHMQTEHAEIRTLLFVYDRASHKLLFRHWSIPYACYVATLSDAERQQVHTDDGLRAIELRVLATSPFATQVDNSTLPSSVRRLCGHKTNVTLDYYTIP